jgi:hypothetical protein
MECIVETVGTDYHDSQAWYDDDIGDGYYKLQEE